jgi:hypothetical protein
MNPANNQEDLSLEEVDIETRTRNAIIQANENFRENYSELITQIRNIRIARRSTMLDVSF